MYLNHNGQITRSDKALIKADNRGFRFGDGLFETMKMVNGLIPLAAYHFDRLMNGMELMQFERPSYLTSEYLLKQIFELTARNNHRQQVRVRLTVFRGEGGLYDLQNNQANFIIQSWSLPDDFTRLNENGLVIDVFPDAKIACDKFSAIKSNNYLPYLMGAFFVKRNQLNDCLLLNTDGHIADASIANVFIVKDGKLSTPPLSDGCVAGVMRRYLLEAFLRSDMKFGERSLTITDIHEADEVFLTNAVYGLKWVKQFRNKLYDNKTAKAIYQNHILMIL